MAGLIANSLSNYLWNGKGFMEAVNSTGSSTSVKVSLGFGDSSYKMGATVTTTGGELITSLPMSTAVQTARIPKDSVVDVQISAGRYNGFVSSTLPTGLNVTSIGTRLYLGPLSAINGTVGMTAGLKGTATGAIDFSNVVRGYKVYRFTSYNRSETAFASASTAKYPYMITDVSGKAYCLAVTDDGTGNCYISSTAGIYDLENSTAFKHFWMSKLNNKFSNGLTFNNGYWNSAQPSLSDDYKSLAWHFSGYISSDELVTQGVETGTALIGMGDARSAIVNAASANSAAYYGNNARALSNSYKTSTNTTSWFNTVGSGNYTAVAGAYPYTLYGWRQWSHTAVKAVWKYKGAWSASGIVP